MNESLCLQCEEGKQRKIALQQAVDKAKVGREINVRTDFSVTLNSSTI